MEVFHYVANVLKTQSLFGSGLNESTIHGSGAIFNEYDYNTEDWLTSTRYNDTLSSTSTGTTSRLIIDKEIVEFAKVEVDQVHCV